MFPQNNYEDFRKTVCKILSTWHPVQTQLIFSHVERNSTKLHFIHSLFVWNIQDQVWSWKSWGSLTVCDRHFKGTNVSISQTRRQNRIITWMIPCKAFSIKENRLQANMHFMWNWKSTPQYVLCFSDPEASVWRYYAKWDGQGELLLIVSCLELFLQSCPKIQRSFFLFVMENFKPVQK